MQIEPIHHHDPAGEIPCGPDRNGAALLIATTQSVMVTCPPCLLALADAGFTPITDGEFEALLRRARGTLARALEPLDVWLARRDAEAAAFEDFTDVLRLELHATPRWQVFKRAALRSQIRWRDTADFY